MTSELRLARTEPGSIGTAYLPARSRMRNLGSAIFLAAIQDYRSMDEDTHQDAKAFLYPQTAEAQDQYDWAVALADGLDPAWLRDALDRCKGKWDGQRSRKSWMRRSRRSCQAKRRGEGDEVRKCS